MKNSDLIDYFEFDLVNISRMGPLLRSINTFTSNKKPRQGADRCQCNNGHRDDHQRHGKDFNDFHSFHLCGLSARSNGFEKNCACSSELIVKFFSDGSATI